MFLQPTTAASRGRVPRHGSFQLTFDATKIPLRRDFFRAQCEADEGANHKISSAGSARAEAPDGNEHQPYRIVRQACYGVMVLGSISRPLKKSKSERRCATFESRVGLRRIFPASEAQLLNQCCAKRAPENLFQRPVRARAIAKTPTAPARPVRNSSASDGSIQLRW